MKNFDILAEGGSAPVVKIFDHIQASADGRIELSFMPVVNYAIVNAIEVLPEDGPEHGTGERTESTVRPSP
jgi:hypothetical protein